jgi:hypothetical protein
MGRALAGAALFVLLTSLAANAQWEPEVKLSTDETAAGLNENMGHCIIANGDTVHVVWMDTKGKDQGIYYKRSADKGATWGPDTRISATTAIDTMPLLAQSGTTLHLVFLRDNHTPQSASYYKRSTDNGLTWGPDVLLGKTKWWPGVAAAGQNVYVSLNTVYADDDKNSVVYFRRSTDNGATWEDQQPMSQATRRTGGRSEDPAIVADGKYVHLVWNDNRDAEPGKGMAVYYRRSADMGATWGPETALTHAPAYTYCPTIFPTGSHVDVAYADRQHGPYNIYHLHSADFGETWSAPEQISKSSTGEVYPAIVRDGSNVHLAWPGKEGLHYLHSINGGKNWEKPVVLTLKGSIAFMAVAGDSLHVIFASQRDGHGAIYYKRNPTGNKSGQ